MALTRDPDPREGPRPTRRKPIAPEDEAARALAERIEVHARWDDLVLPTEQLEKLRAVELHVQHRGRAFSSVPSAVRGSGASVLFRGPSGTGKSLAA